ncbi:PqqD family protein [Aquibium carbonis]|uniref:PqqD family protein n=1 Tax=Aquibium carbonis TaxID=2495581 RepID=A0A429Z0E9_9HYPH|nr:PqqD family protein [Aquibium carbonis]RST87202.1 PqqD family protein [Aquibium carbonis]
MNNLNSAYAVAGSDVAFEVFDGDVIVLDMGNGKYYSFSNGGSAVWVALVAGVAPSDIANHSAHGEAVPGFVKQLHDLGLIEARPSLLPVAADSDQIAALAAANEAPDLRIFDDMADLFLADPIHDVEEPQGWPVVKQA